VDPNRNRRNRPDQIGAVMNQSEPLVTDNIELAFNEFHLNHPEIYAELVSLARFWRNEIGTTVAIATIYEQLRWKMSFVGVMDKSGFKLNNNYRALYARLIMENEPDLKGIFNLRERTTKRLAETR
jgi:hypothetical protein